MTKNKRIVELSVRSREWMLIGSLLLCLLLLLCSMNSRSEVYSAVCWSIPVGFVLLLLGLKEERQEKGGRLLQGIFQNRWLVFLGNISFELFLVHQLCIRYLAVVFRYLGQPDSIWQYIAAVILSIGISCLLKYRFTPWALKGRDTKS